MMQGLLNAMRLQAMLAGGSRVSTLMGTVKGYNPAHYCAKVMIQPENIESGWLPIASPWVGNGWGMAAPPTDGDVVTVVCQDGDINAGIISLRLFGDNARPPSAQSGGTTTYAPSGEFWLVHQSGSLLKFHNDGSVELAANTNLTATVGGNLNANVTGNAVIKAASIALQNSGSLLKKLVTDKFLTSLFDTHVHTSSAPGVLTSPPTVLSTTDTTYKTSVTQAE